ncbi:MAG: hypothetical protein ISQ18_05645 [Candidatus Micropelagos sp.]|nr:hypothetical protein [Candidatus Micropelagos sp.]
MKPILLTIALLFSRPAWAEENKKNDALDIYNQLAERKELAEFFIWSGGQALSNYAAEQIRNKEIPFHCPPLKFEMKSENYKQIYMDYLDENPREETLAPFSVLINALKANFPCPYFRDIE